MTEDELAEYIAAHPKAQEKLSKLVVDCAMEYAELVNKGGWADQLLYLADSYGQPDADEFVKEAIGIDND